MKTTQKLKITITVNESVWEENKKEFSALLAFTSDRLFYRSYVVFAVPVYFTDEEHRTNPRVANNNTLSQTTSLDDLSLSCSSITNEVVRLSLNDEISNQSLREQHDFRSDEVEQYLISPRLPNPQSHHIDDYHDLRMRSVSSFSERSRLSSLQSSDVTHPYLSSASSSQMCISGSRYERHENDGPNNSFHSNSFPRQEREHIRSNSRAIGYPIGTEVQRTNNFYVGSSLEKSPSERETSQNCYNVSRSRISSRRLHSKNDEQMSANEFQHQAGIQTTPLFSHHHWTRPPDQDQAYGAQVHRSAFSVRPEMRQWDIRGVLDYVKTNINQSVVQRLLEKGYSRKEILIAAVYFYRKNEHSGISVSKLLTILQSDSWPDVFRDLSMYLQQEYCV